MNPYTDEPGERGPDGVRGPDGPVAPPGPQTPLEDFHDAQEAVRAALEPHLTPVLNWLIRVVGWVERKTRRRR